MQFRTERQVFRYHMHSDNKQFRSPENYLTPASKAVAKRYFFHLNMEFWPSNGIRADQAYKTQNIQHFVFAFVKADIQKY